jgi:hypothetical protein
MTVALLALVTIVGFSCAVLVAAAWIADLLNTFTTEKGAPPEARTRREPCR